jgi:hypothetical protein
MRTLLTLAVFVTAAGCATSLGKRAEPRSGPEEQSGECSWVVHISDAGCIATVTTNVAEPGDEPGTFDVYSGIGRTFGACGQKFEACGAALVCKCPAAASSVSE